MNAAALTDDSGFLTLTEAMYGIYEHFLVKQTYYITTEGRRGSSTMDDDVSGTFKTGMDPERWRQHKNRYYCGRSKCHDTADIPKHPPGRFAILLLFTGKTSRINRKRTLFASNITLATRHQRTLTPVLLF